MRESAAAAQRRRGRSQSEPAPHRARRGRVARPRPPAKRPMPASSRSIASSSRSRSTASRCARSTAAISGRGRRGWRRSKRGASRRARRSRRGARRRLTPTPSAIARRRRWRPGRTRTTRPTARSKGSRPTSKPRAAKCFRRSTRPRRCGTRSSTPAATRDRVGETLSKLDVEIERRPDRCRARGRRPGRGCRSAAAGAAGDRGNAHRADGPRIRAGQRAHRTRVARAAGALGRARAGGPRSAAEIARGARSGPGRVTATPPARCSRRPTARWNRRAPSRTTSRWRPGTSAPSRPASPTCCSTSSSSVPEHAAAGFGLVREAGAGRCGFLIAVRTPMRRSGSGRTDAAPSRKASSRCRRSFASTARTPAPIRRRDRRRVDRRFVRARGRGQPSDSRCRS